MANCVSTLNCIKIELTNGLECTRINTGLSSSVYMSMGFLKAT